MTEFVQPSLDTPPEGAVKTEALPETVTAAPATELTGSDPLSNALRDSMVVKADPAAALLKAEAPITPKFALEYVLDGQPIRETHMDTAHAVASFQRLKRLGILAKPITL